MKTKLITLVFLAATLAAVGQSLKLPHRHTVVTQSVDVIDDLTVSPSEVKSAVDNDLTAAGTNRFSLKVEEKDVRVLVGTNYFTNNIVGRVFANPVYTNVPAYRIHIDLR